MKPLKLENTVVNVKSQEQWDKVSEYYKIDWDEKLCDCLYSQYKKTTCIEPDGIMGPITTYLENDCTIITFAKWQKLIKEHELKENKMGKLIEIKNTVVNFKYKKDYDWFLNECEKVGWAWGSSGHSPVGRYEWESTADCIKLSKFLDRSCLNTWIESGYKIISVKQLKELIKEHEEQGMKEINSFEDFKRVAKRYANSVSDKCTWIGFDKDGIYEYEEEPSSRDTGLFTLSHVILNIRKDFDCKFNGNKYSISLAELRNEPPKLEDLESGCEIESEGIMYYTNKELLCFIYRGSDNKISTDEYDYKKGYSVSKIKWIQTITSPQGDLIWERQQEVKEVTVDFNGITLTKSKEALLKIAEKIKEACK